MEHENITVGIDLGTTYSAIAFVDKHGDPKIIPNSNNERITPSVVFFESAENIIVGQNAKDEIELSPDKVVSFVKREMGKKKEEVRSDENYGMAKPYDFFDKVYSPEEVSALILKNLKKDAENYFHGKDIRDVVITVPAYFNDSEKKATKDAGEIAGFNVLQVINEPTAAAISYGISKDDEMAQKVFVFDLGGGTFDVTILDVINNNGTKEINIIATDGDHRLGGKDWDDKIIEYVAEEFINQYGEDPRDDSDAMADLRIKSEKMKKSLSDKESAKMLIRTQDNSLKLETSKEKFEEITAELLSRVEGLCNSVFEQAELKWSDIDIILLAGGSSRMPMIQTMLKSISNKEIRTDYVNPDECVAFGAAIHSAIVSLNSDPSNVTQEIRDKLGSVQVNDILTHTLGDILFNVKTNKNYVEPMIKKGTKIPFTITKTFSTVSDNQTAVSIRVTEGESTNVENVTIIQEATLEIVNPMPAGAPIDTTFDLSADGMLTVTAKDVTNNKEITVKIDRASNLSQDAISAASQEIGALKVSS